MARDLAWVIFALPLACTGSIAEGGPVPTEGTTSPTGALRGPDGRPLPPVPATSLRRLTRTEYNLTVRDLIGDNTSPGDALVPDGRKVFDNIASGQRMDEVGIEAYFNVASAIVERAVKPGVLSRAHLPACTLAAGSANCAGTAIQDFARKAWRRPLTDEEKADLQAALDEGRAQGKTVDDGVKVALRSVLVSPHFLFRVERDPPNVAGPHRVTPHELATRLSYFIYSSMPDDELSARADDGTLADRTVFDAQIQRMLADAKAVALSSNFARLWFDTGAVLGMEVSPDPKLFPMFNQELRQSMQQETERLFAAFLAEDRNLLDILDADFTFVNWRLANHYGIPDVTSRYEPERGSLAGTHRVGLLTQGGMLTATSHGTESSFVKRGKYLLTRLLCTDLGPPPADANDQANKPDPNLPANPTRKQLATSLANKRADCHGCHGILDPLGFGLEHFDPVGLWRDRYADKRDVDAGGQLPGGATFDGAAGLSGLIKQDERWSRCATRMLYTYALGREPSDAADGVVIEALDGASRAKGARLRQLIVDLTQTEAFLSRSPSR